MANKKAKYLSLVMAALLGTTTLTACGEETPIQQEIKEAEKSQQVSENDEDSENTDSIDQEISTISSLAEEFYLDFANFDFADTPENRDDIENRGTYREVEELVGEPIFFGEGYPYDVRIPLDNLPPEKSDEVVRILEERYNPPIENSNYSNLTNSEKILFNTYMAIQKKELSLLGGVDSVEIDDTEISFDENDDAIVSGVNVKYKNSSTGEEGADLYVFPLRMYKDSDDNWTIDAVSFIFNFFSPVDPNAPVQNEEELLPPPPNEQ